MTKISATITIDKEIWDLAKVKIGNRSEFIERQFEYALNLTEDEETILRKQIAEHQNEINVLEAKLCKAREKKLKEESKNSNLAEAMETISRIHEKCGSVGRNQIRNIAKQRDVSFNLLVDECLNNDFEIVNFLEAPK